MNTDIFVESPKAIGEETEFFLQRHPSCSTACEAHIHSAVELLYINEGSYLVTLDNKGYTLKAGDLILFCSTAVHHVVAGETEHNSYYVIKIPPTFFIGFSKREPSVKYSLRFALNRKGHKCLWQKEELEGSAIKHALDGLIAEDYERKYAAEVAISLKIMELLVEILRDGISEDSSANDASAELIYNVMGYVNENYAEDIDERELAKSFGMSYSYFSRSFKRVTGMTFRRYLNRTRISKAEQLLLSSDRSISDIATACGYNSISYFISIYRSLTGKTPFQARAGEKRG